tara:strand:- start:11 stop:457 length:447 start_codon:yes stop_codon:yes gene_type:complete
MTKYLNTKPGSVEEVVANMNKALRQDGAYQDMFKKELDKAGKGIGSMSPKEKKDFFNKIDSKYKAKNEDLNSKDASVVKKVMTKLKGASQAHAGQAKDLEKAMKSEADQHGDEINQKKIDKVKSDKKMADSGSKATKVETEPKVDYKN